MKRLDRFDMLTLICTASGTAGCWLIWPPLALLFVAAVAGILAAVVDRRTVVSTRRRK
jgi:hypothetical protein